MKYYTNAFDFPDYYRLPVHTRTKLEQAEDCLPKLDGTLGPWFCEDIDHFNHHRLDDLSSGSILLSHELSDYFMAQGEPVGIDRLRSKSERRALQSRLLPPGFPYVHHAQDFVTGLEQLASYFLNEECLIRTRGLQCVPDKSDARWVFLPPASIRPRLLDLHACLMDNHRRVPSLFCATVAILAIWFCHPFRDGNGRVGRCLFQLILKSGGLRPGVTLPLRELFSLSRGGHLIRARMVLTRDDWLPILDFFSNIVLISAQSALSSVK